MTMIEIEITKEINVNKLFFGTERRNLSDNKNPIIRPLTIADLEIFDSIVLIN